MPAGANIGVILISSVAWGSCMFDADTLRVSRPMQLAFPAYNEDTLKKVSPIRHCLYMMPRSCLSNHLGNICCNDSGG